MEREALVRLGMPAVQAAPEGWAVPGLQVGAAVLEELAEAEAVLLNCRRWDALPSPEISYLRERPAEAVVRPGPRAGQGPAEVAQADFSEELTAHPPMRMVRTAETVVLEAMAARAARAG